MFEIALHSIVSSYINVGINNVAACCGVASVSSVGPIASEKDPLDHHGRAPPKMKLPPRSETSLLSNIVCDTVEHKIPSVPVTNCLLFQSFEKIFLFRLRPPERSGRLTIIPTRNKRYCPSNSVAPMNESTIIVSRERGVSYRYFTA